MRGEIISVGTELLLGQIANTNAQYISKKLAEIGIDVLYHTAVGDNHQRLKGILETAQSRSDLIIFTGGLGPTKDDLTKEAIASHLGKALVEDAPAMMKIEAYFTQRGIEMTENNRKQAQVIDQSTVLPNDHGMAPGMAVEAASIRYILLPGPPRELIPMFDHYAIPYLQSLFPEQQVVHSKVLRFFGIGESALEEKLLDLIDAQSNPTIAPLANEGEVTIRITAKARNIDEANELIQKIEMEIGSRVGEYIYGYNDDTLPRVTFRTLKKGALKLSLAESCTGGLLSQMITSISGSSEIYSGGVISYSSEAKSQLLHVSSALIEEHGTVSEECAKAMAKQAREALNADVALSVTGVAGPDPTENKPVGLVYIGLATPEGTHSYRLNLSGTREGIQLKAAKYSLFYLLQYLKGI